MKDVYDKALDLLKHMDSKFAGATGAENWREFLGENIYIGFGDKLCTFVNFAELFDAVRNVLLLIIEDNKPIEDPNNVTVIIEETIAQSFSVTVPDGEDTHKHICDMYHNEELVVMPNNVIGVSYAICNRDTDEVITEWVPID